MQKSNSCGSWKDVLNFYKWVHRDYEYQIRQRSYVGFRTVQDYMGVEENKPLTDLNIK